MFISNLILNNPFFACDNQNDYLDKLTEIAIYLDQIFIYKLLGEEKTFIKVSFTVKCIFLYQFIYLFSEYLEKRNKNKVFDEFKKELSNSNIIKLIINNHETKINQNNDLICFMKELRNLFCHHFNLTKPKKYNFQDIKNWNMYNDYFLFLKKFNHSYLYNINNLVDKNMDEIKKENKIFNEKYKEFEKNEWIFKIHKDFPKKIYEFIYKFINNI